MNVSSQPRTIPAGTVVSNLEPLSADNVDLTQYAGQLPAVTARRLSNNLMDGR